MAEHGHEQSDEYGATNIYTNSILGPVDYFGDLFQFPASSYEDYSLSLPADQGYHIPDSSENINNIDSTWLYDLSALQAGELDFSGRSGQHSNDSQIQTPSETTASTKPLAQRLVSSLFSPSKFSLMSLRISSIRLLMTLLRPGSQGVSMSVACLYSFLALRLQDHFSTNQIYLLILYQIRPIADWSSDPISSSMIGNQAR